MGNSLQGVNRFLTMEVNRIKYPETHWIRSDDREKSLNFYLEQQSKVYSRIKNAFIKELAGNLKDKDFMDYGCGAGFFIIYGAEQQALSITGVDGEEKILDTARYFAEKKGFHRECDFICSETMPSFQEEKKFDVILLKDVIEHVKDDEKLLKNAAGLLKPEGSVIISTQNSFSLNYLLEGSWEYFIKGNKTWCGWDPTHIRFYTPLGLREKLKKAGLKSVEWRSAYIVPYKIPSFPWSQKSFIRIDSLSIIDKIFGRIFPFNQMGWNITVKVIPIR
jgi:2-polyprenyl-6-hydroxyphenyl methylase/3-demethylubiquinone-9 3-methyltransferase